jgi:ribosome-binding factor A
MSLHRARRIGEQIKRELAELLRLEIKDPRVGFVTLTSVEVSPDLEHAKIFFTLLGSEEPEATSRALNHAAGFLRTQLGRRIRLRAVPSLRFVHDISVERGLRLNQLISQAIAEDKTHSPE